MTENVKAALLMMLALALLAFNDAGIKALARDMPLPQIIVMRNALISAGLLAVLLRRAGAFRLARRDWALVALRAVGEAGAAVFYLAALVNMPFATLTAILQATPLAVTLGAALVLGESVGWRRMAAILSGFAGVLLIVRPGAEGIDRYALYALVSVLFVVLRDLATRGLSKTVPSMTVTLFTSLLVTATYLVLGADTPWVRPAGAALWLLPCIAGLVLGSYLLIIRGMRLGEVAFVSPFRYTALLFALVLGLVLFGEWPDAVTLAGAAIIVASGLFMLYRERKRGVATGTPAMPADKAPLDKAQGDKAPGGRRQR